MPSLRPYADWSLIFLFTLKVFLIGVCFFFCLFYVESSSVYTTTDSHFVSSVFKGVLHSFLVWNIAVKRLHSSLILFLLLVIWTFCPNTFRYFIFINLTFNNFIKLCLCVDQFQSVFPGIWYVLWIYRLTFYFTSWLSWCTVLNNCFITLLWGDSLSAHLYVRRAPWPVLCIYDFLLNPFILFLYSLSFHLYPSCHAVCTVYLLLLPI